MKEGGLVILYTRKKVEEERKEETKESN